MNPMNTYQNPGLYIHIPFCRSKCPYCAFYSLASNSLISQWLNSLKKEIVYYKDQFECFDTLYIGGGTPTFLDAWALEIIMKHILNNFHFAPDTEITIEANPCDLTREKINVLKELGFNRISLGIQSFNDRELLFLGRRHTAKEAETALTLLRSCGFKNISMDLIYGFEGQSLKEWTKTLNHALSFQPEHLSCYQLTFEKQTIFEKMKDKGLIRPINEKEERTFFSATSQFLESHDYIHYEISSFARGKAYYSRHNNKYWHHIPYLGLGPSAHSFQESTRWWNVRSIRRYCELLEGGRAPIEGYENLTEDQLRLESISLGSRTKEGFDLKEIPYNRSSKDMLMRLQTSGLVYIKNNKVIPTKKGFLVADHLACCFF